MMQSISLSRLPNFASIDYDICASLQERKFNVPPNSEIHSCTSKHSFDSDFTCCSHNNNRNNSADSYYADCDGDCPTKRIPTRGSECYQSKPHSRGQSRGRSITVIKKSARAGAGAGGDCCVMQTRFPEIKPLKKKICIPLPCQIRKDDLEFITREIPDPLWNSMYCLERIKVIITTPDLESMSERVEEIWKLYVKLSPNGVYLRDVHELSKVLRYLDIGYSQLSYAPQFLDWIFHHMKKGIRIKIMSENDCNEKLRLTLDGFGRALKFGQPKVLVGVLETLLEWLGHYNDSFKPDQDQSSKQKSKCADLKGQSCFQCTRKMSSSKTESKKKGFEVEPEPEFETRYVAKCQVKKLKKPELIEPMLCKSTFFGAFESSILPSILEQFIATTECNTSYCNALVIIRRLCENSYCIRSCVMNSPIVDTCLLKLGISDPKNEILCRSIELLYSILDFPAEDFNGVKIFTFPSEESFSVLLNRFRFLLMADAPILYSLRNDVALIIYLLALNCPPLRSSFSKRLRDFAAILSNNILTDLNFEVLLDSTHDDLELMQYLIWILDLAIPSTTDYFPIIESYQLVPVMIRILIGPCALIEEAGVDSSSSQMVMRAAGKALITFANLKPLLFLQNEGAGAMLTSLKIFGSSFGDVPLNVVEIFLDILRAILNQGMGRDEDYEEVMPYFAKKEATEIFCDILIQFTLEDNFSVSTEPLLCKILLCCAEMGKYDERQKDVFACKKGVKAIIRLIHQLLYSPAQVRHMTPVLHIMVADCIWHCMADCPTALETFLHNEGMFRLLDLLEIAASPTAQIHLVGLLVELSDYSRCADQMLFWRRRLRNTTARFAHDAQFRLPPNRGLEQISHSLSDTIGDLVEDSDLSLAAMFCDLWREEEKRLGVLRSSQGEIISLEFSLMSEYGRNYKRKLIPRRPLQCTSAGPACLDLMMTIRPRIYLLVKNITDQTNTEATLYSGLGILNQITMQIILHFLDLKRAEIWFEIEKELEAEQLTLVKSDRTGLNCILKIHRNKVAAVMDTQRFMIHREKEQAAMNERELYSMLRNCQLQDHLMALREAQYYATTSDYYLLIDKRLWHKTEVNDIFFREAHSTSVQLIKRQTGHSIIPQIKLGDGDGMDTKVDSNKNSMAELGDFGPTIELETQDERRHTSFEVHEVVNSQVMSVQESPISAEDGIYQVAPTILFRALTKLLAQQNIWKQKNISVEQAWIVGRKWNPDWYPREFDHA